MKDLILSIDDGYGSDKLRLSFKKGLLLIEANEPLPLENVTMESKVNRYSFLYSKEIPLSEELVAIRSQFEKVDFSEIFIDQQESDWRNAYTLRINWGSFDGVSLTVRNINRCNNHEAIRLHGLMQTLFCEINMEGWYVVKK